MLLVWLHMFTPCVHPLDLTWTHLEVGTRRVGSWLMEN
jgi:hypothetical protein